MTTYHPFRGMDGHSASAHGQAEDLSRRPAGTLVSELLEEGRHLVRAEVRLAKAELRDEAKKLGRGAGLAAGGAVLLGLGGLTLAAFLVLALATVMPAWGAALLVAVLFIGAGAALGSVGLGRLKQVHGPKSTIQTLQEDSQWANKTMHAVKSQPRVHA